MSTTRAIRVGHSQIVEIPAEMAFDDDQELTVTRHGDVVTIAPKHHGLRRVVEDLLAAAPLPPTEPLTRIEIPERDRF